jgi:hypothetical protein
LSKERKLPFESVNAYSVFVESLTAIELTVVPDRFVIWKLYAGEGIGVMKGVGVIVGVMKGVGVGVGLGPIYPMVKKDVEYENLYNLPALL